MAKGTFGQESGARGAQPEDRTGGVLRQVAAQLNNTMNSIHYTITKLAAPEVRDADPKADMYAAILSKSYYSVLRLANNLEAAAELGEPGAAELENTDLAALCRDVVDKAKAPAELAKRSLEFICKEQQVIAAVDGKQIKRLLLNLISNAIKFTEDGGHIEVELWKDRQKAMLTVTDDGRGIPDELLDTVYDRYLHTELLDPPPHGLGLGLPICRHIVEAHHGGMMLTSPEGGGVKATVFLPIRRMDKGTAHTPITVDLYGGFNDVLMELSDALPREAFTQKYMD